MKNDLLYKALSEAYYMGKEQGIWEQKCAETRDIYAFMKRNYPKQHTEKDDKNLATELEELKKIKPSITLKEGGAIRQITKTETISDIIKEI